MPEPNSHTCVCGYETAYWGNLLGHRRTCDSWKEHIRAIRAGERHEAHSYSVVPADQRPSCPYCDREFGNRPLLFAHLGACTERKNREVAAAAQARQEADRLSDHLDRLAEFEAWCVEHDRP